jgi:hypothetical protein
MNLSASSRNAAFWLKFFSHQMAGGVETPGDSLVNLKPRFRIANHRSQKLNRNPIE